MTWQIRSRRGLGNTGGKQAGAGCLIPFGLVFGGMGAVFTVFLINSFVEEAQTYGWTETPAEILRCEIEVESGNDNPFRLAVEYRYDFDGREWRSERYTLQEQRGDDYEKLALQRRDLLKEGPVVCYVNPEAPEEAVLKRQALFMGLIALFPLVFVVIGGAIVWAGVSALRKRKTEGGKDSGRGTAISGGGSTGSAAGGKVGVAFGGIFAVVGLVVGVVMVLGPVRRMAESRQWVETPCAVIWSRVQSHSSDDGTTYSVDIFYEYEFAGEKYRSNRYQGMGGSSSGRSGKQEVVRQYPRGSRQICYVNPDLPEQAILKPGFSAWALILLLPLVFFVIGVAVLLTSLRSRKRKRAMSARTEFPAAIGGASLSQRVGDEPLPGAPPMDPGGDRGGRGSAEPIVLSAGGGRLKKVFGVLAFALFWNGIVSVFLVEMVRGWRSGNGEIFLTLFLIPFVLIGLAAILLFFYQLLAAANPRPVITLVSGTVRLGEPISLTWKLSGNVSRVSRLEISLWGLESATYQRGTNTATSHEVFYERKIAEAVATGEIREGSAGATIPEDLVYSMDLGNNEIKYQIRVSGSVPLWPDIQDSFDLAVLPGRFVPGTAE